MTSDDPSVLQNGFEQGLDNIPHGKGRIFKTPRGSFLRLDPDAIRRPNALLLYTVGGGEIGWERLLLKRIPQTVAMYNQLVNRDPTQQECNDLLELQAHSTLLTRMGYPLGLAATAANVYQVERKTNNLPSGRAFLRAFYQRVAAQPALMLWNTGVRMLVWVSFSALACHAYASFRATNIIRNDSRFEALVKGANVLATERLKKLEAMREKRKGKIQDVTESTDSDQSQAISSADVSPVDTPFGESKPFSDSGSRQSFPTWGRAPAQTGQTSQSSGDFFDDASPTAPEFQIADATERAQTENAWERIRRGNIPGAGSPQTGVRNNPLETPSSYPYNDSEDERRRRDREQAQKEFDQMLEAERRLAAAGDSTNDTGRRWG